MDRRTGRVGISKLRPWFGALVVLLVTGLLVGTGGGAQGLDPAGVATARSTTDLADVAGARGFVHDPAAGRFTTLVGAARIDVSPFGDVFDRGAAGVAGAVARATNSSLTAVDPDGRLVTTGGVAAETGLADVVDAGTVGGSVIVLHDGGAAITWLDAATGAIERSTAVSRDDAVAVAGDPADGSVLVLAGDGRTITRLGADGTETAAYTVSGESVGGATGMAVAPSADLTDAASTRSLFVLVSDGSSGRVVELGLAEPTVEAARLSAGVAAAAAPPVPLTLTATRQLSNLSPPSPDSAGVTYMADRGRLMVSDSEVNEMSIFAGANLFELNLNGSLVNTGDSTTFSNEPTGVGYDPVTDTLFVSDDSKDDIFMVDAGGDNRFGTNDDTVDSFDTRDFNSEDPEGVGLDETGGIAYVTDGVNKEIYRIDPNTGGFDGTAAAGGDDTVTSFDTASAGAGDPEGVTYDEARDRVLVVDNPSEMVYEFTETGTLTASYDISAADGTRIAGITLAPASSGGGQALYIVDRGIDNGADPNENDGKLYEFAFPVSSALPSITAGTNSVGEGDSGSTTRSIPVTLDETSSSTVTVDYTTVPLSGATDATAGVDYAPRSGTLTFSPGVQTRWITLTVYGDTLDENNEIVTVQLSNPTNGTIAGDGRGSLTINDDDVAPVVKPGGAGVVEGDAGTRVVNVPVRLTEASGRTITMDWSTLNSGTAGVANSPGDYVADSGTLVFSPGQTERTIPITVRGDTLVEPPLLWGEWALVRIQNVNAATLDLSFYGLGIGVIIDDD